MFFRKKKKDKDESGKASHDSVSEHTKNEHNGYRILSVERIEHNGPSSKESRSTATSTRGKLFWILTAIISAIWILLPEPSDLVPVLGWLDEGLAFYLLITSLNRLGIRIPFLENFFSWRTGRK